MLNQILSKKLVSKAALFIFLCSTMLTISSCKKNTEDEDTQYRKIAWDFLSEASRSTITTQLETAPVEKPSRYNPNAVSVTFNTTQDGLLGPIIVLISIREKKALSIMPRF